MAIRPDKFPRWATTLEQNGPANTFNVVEPDEVKKDIGWSAGEKPPRNWQNWLQLKTYEWLTYLTDLSDTAGNLTRNLSQDVDNTSGLNYAYLGGLLRTNGTLATIAPGSIAVTDNVSTSIYVDTSDNTVKATTGVVPARGIKLALVTASAGEITSVADERTWAYNPAQLQMPNSDINLAELNISNEFTIKLSNAQVAKFSESGSAGRLELQSSGTTQTFISAAAGQDSYIANGGDLLIGLTSSAGFGVADRKLIVNGASSSRLELGTSSVQNGGLYSDGSRSILYTSQATPLDFQTNSTQRVRISEAGSVGLNTTNPVCLLDLNIDGAASTDGPIIRLGTQSSEGAMIGGMAFTENRGTSPHDVTMGMYYDGVSNELKFTGPASEVSLNNSMKSAQVHLSIGRDTGNVSVLTGSLSVNNGQLQIGSVDGIIRSPANMFFAIDSDNNSTANKFEWKTNTADSVGGISLAILTETGSYLIGKTSTDGPASTGHQFDPSGLAIHSRSSGIGLAVDRKNTDGALIQFQRDALEIGSIEATGGNVRIDTINDLLLSPSGDTRFDNGGVFINSGDLNMLANNSAVRFNGGNGVISTLNSMYFNIDSNADNADTEQFRWAKNSGVAGAGDTLMVLSESGNLLIGKNSSDGSATTGHQLEQNGSAIHSVASGNALIVDRKSTDGSVIQIQKDDTQLGNIELESDNLKISAVNDLILNPSLDTIFQSGNVAISSGILTLGEAGIANAIINSPDAMYFNIDSNNDSGGEAYIWGNNRSGQTGGTELMRLDAATGSLSIGTTTNTAPLTVFQTDTNDAIHLTADGTATSFVQMRGDNDAGIRIRGGGSFDGGTIELGGGLRAANPGTIKMSTGTASTPVDALFIDADQNVGIGTGNPACLLDLNVTGAAGTDGPVIRLGTSSSEGSMTGGIGFSENRGSSPNGISMGMYYDGISNLLKFTGPATSTSLVDSLEAATTHMSIARDSGDLTLSSGQLLVTDGTPSTPSIAFGNDPDTGFLRSGTNSVEITTGGETTAIFNASGNMVLPKPTNALIGTGTSDGADNHSISLLSGGSDNSNRGGYFQAYGNEHSTNAGDTFVVAGNVADAQLLLSATSSSGSIVLRTNALDAMTVDSSQNVRVNSGRLLVGKSSPDGSSTTGHQFDQDGLAIHSRSGGLALAIDRKVSDGDIAQFQKDALVIGNIGVSSSNLVINSVNDLIIDPGLDVILTDGDFRLNENNSAVRFNGGNGVISTLNSMYFNIDSNADNADTEQFRWAKNSGAAGAGTTLMALSESGQLDLTGTLNLNNNSIINASFGSTTFSDTTPVLTIKDNNSTGVTASTGYLSFTDQVDAEIGAIGFKSGATSTLEVESDGGILLQPQGTLSVLSGGIDARSTGSMFFTMDSDNNATTEGFFFRHNAGTNLMVLDEAGVMAVTAEVNAPTIKSTTGSVVNGGFDFILGNTDQLSRGDSGESRALVKGSGSTLILNFDGDFTGGTRVDGTLRSTQTFTGERIESELDGTSGSCAFRFQSSPNSGMNREGGSVAIRNAATLVATFDQTDGVQAVQGLTIGSNSSVTKIERADNIAEMYAGRADGAGSGAASSLPSGWSISSISAGRVRITHNLGTTNYAVTATVNDSNNAVSMVSDITTTSFDIYTQIHNTGTFQNHDTGFVVHQLGN